MEGGEQVHTRLMDDDKGETHNHQRRGTIHRQDFHAILPMYRFNFLYRFQSTWLFVVEHTQHRGEK